MVTLRDSHGVKAEFDFEPSKTMVLFLIFEKVGLVSVYKERV